MLEAVPGVLQAQELGQHEVQERDRRDDEDDGGPSRPRVRRIRGISSVLPDARGRRVVRRPARGHLGISGGIKASVVAGRARAPMLGGSPPCTVSYPRRPARATGVLATAREPPESRDPTACGPSRPAAPRRADRRRSAHPGRRAPDRAPGVGPADRARHRAHLRQQVGAHQRRGEVQRRHGSERISTEHRKVGPAVAPNCSPYSIIIRRTTRPSGARIRPSRAAYHGGAVGIAQ